MMQPAGVWTGPEIVSSFNGIAVLFTVACAAPVLLNAATKSMPCPSTLAKLAAVRTMLFAVPPAVPAQDAPAELVSAVTPSKITSPPASFGTMR